MTFDIGTTSGSNMNYFRSGQSVGPRLFPVTSILSKVCCRMLCGTNVVFSVGPILTSGATTEDYTVFVSSLVSLEDRHIGMGII